MPLESPHSRWPRLAAGLWVVILLAICGRLLVSSHAHSVYPIFVNAARNWLAEKDLYRSVSDSLDAYRYSPIVAVAFVPFTGMPDRIGNCLWVGLNAAFLLGGFSWWIRSLLPGTLTRNQRALLFLLIIPLSVGSLNNGQSNALVIGLLLMATACIPAQRWNLAAACVAGACLFKLYPIAVGMLLVAIYPRRFGHRLGLALALGLALPFLLKPSSFVATQYESWIHYLQTDNRDNWTLDVAYRDIRFPLRLWDVRISPRAYLAVQLLVAAAMGGICLAKRSQGYPQRRLLILLLGLGCCWMTVFGPATESCTYILVAPTLAWALLESSLERRPLWCRGLLFLSSVQFTVAQMLVWFPGGSHQHMLRLHAVAGLALLLALLREGLATRTVTESLDSPQPIAIPGRAA